MPNGKVTFSREGVQPPGRFYLQPVQRLEIRSWCSVEAVQLAITGLVLTPEGTIQEISELHSPNGDRSEASELFNLFEGFLLHLQVQETTGLLQHGECFVTLHIVRGLAGAATRVATLLADYVNSMVFPTYPASDIHQSVHGHGAVKSITGTDPAATVEISETVPPNARWIILAVHFTLVTGVDVADRIIHLQLDDGVSTFADICSTTVHTAGTTKVYNFANFGSTQIAPVDCLYVPLPLVPLLEGYRVRTSTELIVGTDNYSAPQLLIEEWLVR
ncbi:hypothetical protein ES708_21159 [subsurface metagenome]